MAPIEKSKVKIRITTTNNMIEGYLSKPESSRTLDLLNSKDKFIAVTDAVVNDGEWKARTFVAINVANIVSVEEI